MDRERRKKRNVSMLELICTLCILVFVSIFLIKLFLGANALKSKARDISKACFISETIGETIKGCGTVEEAVEQLNLEQIQNNFATSIYEKYYDSSWIQVKRPGKYRIIVTMEQQQAGKHKLYDIEIIVKYEKEYAVIRQEEGQELISLHVSTYK